MWSTKSLLVALCGGGLLSLSGDAPAIYKEGGRQVCVAELTPGQIELGSSVTIQGRIARSLVDEIKSMPEPPVEIVMHNSPGGYVEPARELARSGMPIRITGESCASACVMMLIESANACIEDSVQTITFHTVMNRSCSWGQLVTKVVPETTLGFVEGIREPLRTELWHLAEREVLYSIPASYFLAVYPEKRCG